MTSWRLVLGIGFVLAFLPLPAKAHVVMGSTTLRLLTLQADVVLRAKITNPTSAFVLEDPPLRQATVEAQVLEPLKGSHPLTAVRFIQRGHGVVSYDAGDEVLLFLRNIESYPELAASRVAKHIGWVSEQESGARYSVDESSRAELTRAVRAYISMLELPSSAQPGALRRITVELLGSPHRALAASALHDVVISADAPIISAEDLPVLEPLISSDASSIGLRIGILAELERRRIVTGPERWAKLLKTTRGPDLLAVVRAAGMHPGDEVAAALVALLASDDIPLAASAAVSLGSMRYDVAVEPLTKLFDSNELRLRMAAVRGLGRVGTARSLDALKLVAKSHPDPATRRRAAAEVKVATKQTKATHSHHVESP